MKRIMILLAIAALALPATALAKGPSGASVEGPGTGGEINITGGGESSGTPLGDLTQQAGFFPAMFGQQPDPMLDSRPKGNLGPRYTITYTVPDQSGEVAEIRQDVYPYANPPVTYTEPGQKFFGSEQTRGGWFVADPQLKQTLVAAGLPTSPTAASSDDSFVSAGALFALVAALALLLASAAVILRRRARPAAA